MITRSVERTRCATDSLREPLRCIAGAEAEDPTRELLIGGGDACAVDLEEGQHRDEADRLVAVDEELAFGQSVGEHRCLKRGVGAVVVRVRSRTAKRALQAATVAQVVGGLVRGAADDRSVQLKGIVEPEVDGLGARSAAGHRRSGARRRSVGIVLREDAQRLSAFPDDAAADVADLLADLVGAHDPQLAAGHLLDED